MGAEPRKQEPKNCKEWKEKASVWQILEKGNVTPYLEHLHGFKPHVTEAFLKNWFEDRVTMHGVTVHITEDFIAEVTGLPKEGMKFSKETGISNTTFKKFPKIEEEEKKMEKNGDFYELNQIKVIWRDVLLCIHEYFILDGRAKRVHKFHFVFLNHFWYKDRIYFSFYLKFSLF
jgi:hypothetical protein